LEVEKINVPHAEINTAGVIIALSSASPDRDGCIGSG
jgi:hypothetical protein